MERPAGQRLRDKILERRPHTCSYELESSDHGYLTGAYVCQECGAKLHQSQWLRIYKATFQKSARAR